MSQRVRFLALALLFATPALAAAPPEKRPGAGELSLDRGAVTALLQANIPPPATIRMPPLGQVTLRLEAPEPVVFSKGGLETRIAVRIPEVGMSGDLAVRYLPVVDSEAGIVRLKPVKATPLGALGTLPDLAGFLAPVELPRTFDWIAAGRAGRRTRMTVNVQGVEVTDERLVVKLGLVAQPMPAQVARQE
ncbi:MAG: hypothetical protein KBD01_14295 [Acidobacteria bacterium]|nr:hypothetical protein [Acidobacteriota bacterium]